MQQSWENFTPSSFRSRMNILAPVWLMTKVIGTAHCYTLVNSRSRNENKDVADAAVITQTHQHLMVAINSEQSSDAHWFNPQGHI